MAEIINDFLETGYEPSYNVKPTNSSEIWLAGEGGLSAYLARWWLIPHWFKGDDAKAWKATTFNARIEDAAQKPSFRDAWREGRCLVPARGYFEWKDEGEASKQPYFVEERTNRPFLTFAGLYTSWKGQLTFTIMTRAASEAMRDLHPRMPVILNSGEAESWLGGANDLSIGSEVQLQAKKVHKFGLHDEGEALIEPWEG